MDILILRPMVSNIRSTEVFAFFVPDCGWKGAADLHNRCLRAFDTVGRRQRLSLFVSMKEGNLKTKQIFTVLFTLGFFAAFILLMVALISSGEDRPTPPVGLNAVSISKIKAPAEASHQGEYTNERFVADGLNNTFRLKDSYDDVTIGVNGKIQSIGTYHYYEDCTMDVCYDFTGKKMIFSYYPKKGSEIYITGYPSLK